MLNISGHYVPRNKFLHATPLNKEAFYSWCYWNRKNVLGTQSMQKFLFLNAQRWYLYIFPRMFLWGQFTWKLCSSSVSAFSFAISLRFHAVQKYRHSFVMQGSLNISRFQFTMTVGGRGSWNLNFKLMSSRWTPIQIADNPQCFLVEFDLLVAWITHQNSGVLLH